MYRLEFKALHQGPVMFTYFKNVLLDYGQTKTYLK